MNDDFLTLPDLIAAVIGVGVVAALIAGWL